MIEMDEVGLNLPDESPLTERWPPLGQSASPDLPITVEPKKIEANRIKELEEEKEQLSSSLFSLTTKFAQIQFRLHQITEASQSDKDELLSKLEEFANGGCVDSHSLFKSTKESESTEISKELKDQQDLIIHELKSQLNDLESFAYKQGNGSLPQSVQLEKQQALLEQLVEKLNLRENLDDISTTSVDDLKTKMDGAVSEIINLAKMKQQIVDHLQTQIQDLERFLQFRQIEINDGQKSSGSVPTSSLSASNDKKKERKQTLAIIRKAMALIHVFSIAQFGCGAGSANMPNSNSQQYNPETNKNLIGDLKKTVNRLRVLSSTSMKMRKCDGESDSSDDSTSTYSDSEDDKERCVADDLTQYVRKEFCQSLHNILANGLLHDAIGKHSSLISPISCILPRHLNTAYSSESMHPWALFLEYYEIKHGQELAKAPSRMLSRSFNLEDLVAAGDNSRTKYSLLEAIHLVVNDHNPLKRSYDAMFKALVCLGLNTGRLSRWIRLISRSSAIISNHYSDQSYVAHMGMEGVVTVLSRLDNLHFRLPVDVAVRPFKNIRDAF